MRNLFLEHFYPFIISLTLFETVISHGELEGGGGVYHPPAELKLELAQVIFRHGDRNPIDPYPNDPYKDESFWPEGYAQLTKLGKQQQYTLGKFLRHRYKGYLNVSYSPYEIYVQSSDVDRTLMSAQVDLAGLYPPVDNWSMWNTKIPWQPIPVHTRPSNEDNVLRMSKPCPRLTQLIDDFNNGTVMQQIYEENKELFEFLGNKSGKAVKTLQSLDYLYDALFIEFMHNYTLPEWTHKVFPSDPRKRSLNNQFFNLTAMSFKVPTWNQEMKRLKAGPLIKEIVQKFVFRAEKVKDDKGKEKLDPRMKLFVYSAHDTTIASFLHGLDIYNGLPPPYATAVIMELYKNETNGQHLVQFYFRNTTTHSPYILTLPGCEFSCPVERMVELTKPVTPDEWDAECVALGFLGLRGFPLIALILVAFLVILLIVTLLAIALVKSRKGGGLAYPYLHLQTDDTEDA